MKDVLVVHGDYPRSKSWDDLVSFAKLHGVEIFVEGKSVYDVMRDTFAAGITYKQQIDRLKAEVERYKSVVEMFAEYNEMFADRKCYAIPGVKIKIASDALLKKDGQ